jgi:hypothetical protein
MKIKENWRNKKTYFCMKYEKAELPKVLLRLRIVKF